MIKTIKTTILLISFIFTANVFALDQKSQLSEDANAVVNNVSEYLKVKLDTKSKLAIYNDIFKSYINSGNWNLYPVNDNTSIQGSKSDKSPVTFLEYVLSYKERTVFISLINHSKQKQITYTIKEVVPISSKRVLELYGEVSKDKKHETLYDTDSYSLFKKKGYIDYTLYHITGDQGIVSYTYAGIINY